MDGNLKEILNKYLDSGENVILSGLSGTARAFFLDQIFRTKNNYFICLAPTEEDAFDLARSLSEFIDRKKILMFLGRDFVYNKKNYTRSEKERIITIQECIMHPHRHQIIITTPAGIMHKLDSPRSWAEKIIRVECGQEIELNQLLVKLVSNAYNRVETVSNPGEFAVRGGILDFYSVGSLKPYRLEFFGDIVESIRSFDLESQRSTGTEKDINIGPARELLSEFPSANILTYLDPNTTVFFDEPREFMSNLNKNLSRYRESAPETIINYQEKVLKESELERELGKRSAIYHSFFPGNIATVKAGYLQHISQKNAEYFVNDYERFFIRLKEWIEKGYFVYLYIKSRAAREQLKSDLVEHHISGVQILNGRIENGFVSQTLKTVLITEKEIWGKQIKPLSRKHQKGQERVLLESLKVGDYVVHENYGIGIFNGISQEETDGITREYILLQYAGADRLYLPLDKLNMLYLYNASEEKRPRLNKLGGSDWEKTKARVAQSIQEMAEKLLELYAARQSMAGYAFSPDTIWQQQFEGSFPFQETPDQLKAVKSIKEDMELPQPMDRLVCGDVGYGKTEVIMRAAFKAVMDGKQAAVLVPTTVLADQHFHTFKERFREYPINIEVISRFRSSSAQRKIISELHKGAIDIIIGTHRLLSKDVDFYDLGLLVIDEEHRFGVAQKEKIKMYKNVVDVISLSATPIPRSLHMAMAGLRDLSVIETPPPERYPIETYVLEYNEEVIFEAIQAEVARKGQVFFVHNRIEDIYDVRNRLQGMLPDFDIAIGHGRMKEDELSKVISSFLAGNHHIFLCTTIIESGLDMPNVNTIIVDEADKMGLAQLYQLRGRVGRSNRIAYAYLTYKPDLSINETAQKRLSAIREFNELGAGMKIALRDLEIRGAGNILGSEQHGYIQAVGFDLYCSLLEQETNKLKGIERSTAAAPALEVDIDYYIPDSYIPDSGTKIRIYRRLMMAAEEKDIKEVREELLDRFGRLPLPVENFIKLSSLRIAAGSKKIKSLKKKGERLEIEMERPLSPNTREIMTGIKKSGVQDNIVTINFEEALSLDKLGEILEVL